MLLRYMVDEYNLDLDKDTVNLISQLITPDANFLENDIKKHKEHGWIFEIVANYRTSIDVDRFDYMMRDPRNVGVQEYVFDCSMFFENFQVMNNQIVFDKKMACKLNDFFHNRYRLFKHVYLNASTTSFELMLQDL